MFGWKKRQRKKIRRRPFPPEWSAVLRKNVPFVKFLGEEDREKLLGDILIFLAEKNFEGCGGLAITDEIRVTIAAQACLLILHRGNDYYPRLRSILVYPRAYRANSLRSIPGGMVAEGDEVRVGESWPEGAVVLSWDDVRQRGSDSRFGYNVVLHEFAHQLDQEDGVTDDGPNLSPPSGYSAWARVLEKEYRQLVDAVEAGRRPAFDPSGVLDPAEFFAVITEEYFEKPLQLRRGHPELYDQLRLFYRLDPAAWRQ